MIDLTGKRFGRLVVVGRAGSSKNKSILWECICDCGNRVIKDGVNLRCGDTKSCGCLHRDSVKKTMQTHAMSKTRLYRVWAGVKSRCYNEHADNYKYYGARGIHMCDQWKDNFYEFFRWAISSGYKEDASAQECTLDRIDNLGDYSPDNCRWSTHKTQCNNQRSNLVFELNGETHTMSEWADIFNIKYTTLRARIRRGVPFQEAVKTK